MPVHFRIEQHFKIGLADGRFFTAMTKTFKNYTAFGMNIGSEIPLPDLQKSVSPADVEMRFGKLTDDLINEEFAGTEVFTNPGVKVRAARQAMFFDWDRLGKVLVRGGREVIVEPDADTLEEDLQPFLTGAVLAVLLHQRGSFVLHASAEVSFCTPARSRSAARRLPF
jgi:hypothetical protein